MMRSDLSSALMAQIFCYGFGAGLDVKFFVNAAEISADGVYADVQLVGNLFVSETFGEAVQHHLLAR